MDDSAPVNVNVKWSKKTLPVEIDTSEPPAVFMSQLWTLTGVPPERQTILGLKGGKLKDSAQWADLNLRANMNLILMGTADSNRLAPPPKQPAVANDLDLDKPPVDYNPVPVGPPGLVNLGNTCYMNATVQCLHAVAPLSAALNDFRGSTTALNPAEKLTASLRDVFSRLKSRNSDSVNPASFLGVLRQVNPQFAERGNTGFFMQQDAEECWGELLTRLATALSGDAAEAAGEAAAAGGEAKAGGAKTNRIDDLFAITMRSEDKCDESDESISRSESVRALKCHISSQVSHVNQGIKEGLSEKIEKNSEQLGRSTTWSRSSRMHTLPPFLVVQFVRFYWKAAEAVKAKILRRVSFPVELDVFDYCTDELKESLSKKRDAARAEADAKIHADAKAEPAESAAASKGDAAAAAADAAAGPATTIDATVTPAETGRYELFAVLTHKGRAADSGHYVSWVKGEDGKWYLFDDDKVSVHTEEEVKKLCGGGDWHMAYMCLYRSKNTM